MFSKAKPVWAKELQGVMNAGIVARGTFEVPQTFTVIAGTGLICRLAGMSHYRVWCNDTFVALGPARTAHGHARVDELDLRPFARPGQNELRIELTAYHAWTYSHVADPGFLQAEVILRAAASTADESVLLATSLPPATAAGERMPPPTFTLHRWSHRNTKVRRFTFQRAFLESYDLARPDELTALTPVERAPRRLLPRGAPYPTYPVTRAARLLATGSLHPRDGIAESTVFSWEKPRPEFKQYDAAELESDPLAALATFTPRPDAAPQPSDLPPSPAIPLRLAPNRFALLTLGRNLTGTIRLTVASPEGARLVVSFDEMLDGRHLIDPRRVGCSNCIEWHVPAGTNTLDLESHEPYTLQFLMLHCLSGTLEVTDVSLRHYENPEAARAHFASGNPELATLFEAARASFAQNAVDLFMDCPGRERAGWLSDSYFTARAALLLTGNTTIEHSFLQNYLLAPPIGNLPDGMLPMCYPADHPNGTFIPQWPLWLILQLKEYAVRDPSPAGRALVEAFKPKIEKLLSWFERFEREDGVLTALPSWSFIEWSKANDFQKDLNYPTSMLYAAALDTAGALWSRPEWSQRAARIRTAVAAESFDGTFFRDNATAQKDSTVPIDASAPSAFIPQPNHTEVCQYYAFYFGVATRESHPELWRKLTDDFGPHRQARGLHPGVHKANVLWGIMLRLELLRSAGGTYRDQAVRELKDYFLPMARATGTLWEHDNPGASCNHGFASHAVVVLLEAALGATLSAKTLTLTPPPADLDSASALIPVPEGLVHVAWHRNAGEIQRTASVPDGYKTVDGR